MKDAKLRRMIADCLKYLKKQDWGWLEREDVEVTVVVYETTYGRVSLAEVLGGIDPKDYDKLFLRGKSYRDCDGFEDSSEVELYSYRKQTDQEYFDSICQYILPTEYQQEQYETYLRLKEMFEGVQCAKTKVIPKGNPKFI